MSEGLLSGLPEERDATFLPGIDSVSFREPVLSERIPDLEGAWPEALQAMYRAVLAKPEARRTMATFMTEPVDEDLPYKAVRLLSPVDAQVSRLTDESNPLGTVLSYPKVPDEAIGHDLRSARQLLTKRAAHQILLEAGPEDGEAYAVALDTIRHQALEPGITRDEYALALERFKWARDIKILALAGELTDNPLRLRSVGDGTLQCELPSGARLVVTEEAYTTASSLLDPKMWVRREELQDRVYRITTRDGGHYILKERKTDRHRRTRSTDGHVDGLTSEEEFRITQELASLAPTRQGDVVLRYEKPLGYVQYPDGRDDRDGFQFCIFEDEAEMDVPGDHRPFARPKFVEAILNAPEAYVSEYRYVQEKARALLADRPQLMRDDRRSFLADDELNAEPDELTFEEFAGIWADFAELDAKKLLIRVSRECGVINTDGDDAGYRVRDVPHGERPTLEIIGFDFEYAKIPRLSVEMIEQFNQLDEIRLQSGRLPNIYNHGRRKVCYAASLAMLQERGYRLPVPHAQPTPNVSAENKQQDPDYWLN